MNIEQAEVIGLKALSYMAANEDILLAYLNLSGITPDELKNSISDSSTLGSILDYFLQNEKRLITLCETEDILPNNLIKARQALPGGEFIPYST